MALAGLDKSPLALAFRKVERVLRDSKTLNPIVDAWRVVRDAKGDELVAVTRGKVALALSASVGAQGWYSPASHRAELIVTATMAFDESDAEQYLDFWWAIEKALYPSDEADRLALQKALRDDFHFLTGQPRFTWPQPDERASAVAQRFVAAGRIAYDVELFLDASPPE